MALLGGDAKPSENPPGLGLQLVSAEGLEEMPQLSVTGDEPLLMLARDRAHLLLEPFELLLHPADGCVGVEHLREDRPSRRRARRLLGQIADRRASRVSHRPLVASFLAGQDPQKGRLSGSVGSDQPDARTAFDVPVETAQQHPARVLLEKPLDLDHDSELNWPVCPDPLPSLYSQ